MIDTLTAGLPRLGLELKEKTRQGLYPDGLWD